MCLLKYLRIIAISFALIACPVLVSAQSTVQYSHKPSVWEDLSKTYGFCYGQNLSLIRIQQEFPELSTKVQQTKMEFDLVFKPSYLNIESILRKFYDDKWSEYKSQLQNYLEKILSTSRLTKQQAIAAINQVIERAQGQIESPILETLLSYKPSFQKNPVMELQKGFKKVYRTKRHPKSKGLDFQIEYPKSWTTREGHRPNIIQFFRSKNGRGTVTASIMTRDIVKEAQEQFTSEELLALKTLQGSKEIAEELFTDEGLKEMAKGMGVSNIRNIETKRVTIDNWPGAMVEFIGKKQRVDVEFTIYTRMYIAIYKSYMVFLQFGIARLPSDKNEDFKSRISGYVPLFRHMANSLVIQSQY